MTWILWILMHSYPMNGGSLLSHCWFQSAPSLVSDGHEVAVTHDCQPREERMK